MTIGRTPTMFAMVLAAGLISFVEPLRIRKAEWRR